MEDRVDNILFFIVGGRNIVSPSLFMWKLPNIRRDAF